MISEDWMHELKSAVVCSNMDSFQKAKLLKPYVISPNPEVMTDMENPI